MICQFCGKQVGDNDKICKYCGSSLVRPAVNNNHDVKRDNNVKNIETSETETYRSVQNAGRTNRKPANTNFENNADMTVAIPKIDGRGSGFENSRAAEEDGIPGNVYQGGRNRRQPQPVKKQYYRYNPDQKTKKNTHRQEQQFYADNNYEGKRVKQPSAKRHPGKFIIKVAGLAIIGFIIGLLIYIVSANASNWFKTRSNPADIPASAPTETVKPKSSNGAVSDTKSSSDKSSAGNDKENSDKKTQTGSDSKPKDTTQEKSTQRTDAEKKTDRGEEKKTQPADSGEDDTKKAEEPVEDNTDDTKTEDETNSDTGNEESVENAESGLED